MRTIETKTNSNEMKAEEETLVTCDSSIQKYGFIG